MDELWWSIKLNQRKKLNNMKEGDPFGSAEEARKEQERVNQLRKAMKDVDTPEELAALDAVAEILDDAAEEEEDR